MRTILGVLAAERRLKGIVRGVRRKKILSIKELSTRYFLSLKAFQIRENQAADMWSSQNCFDHMRRFNARKFCLEPLMLERKSLVVYPEEV
jgi:hypothetical protein